MPDTPAPPPTRAVVKKRIPRKIILYAVEGWGKSTTVGYMDSPHVIMCGLEKGFSFLLADGRFPGGATCAHADSYFDIMKCLDTVPTGAKSVIIDTIGSAETLISGHACSGGRFRGDWDKFDDYGKGSRASVHLWLALLGALEKQYDSGRDVVLLGHSKVETFNDPHVGSYDRHVPDLERKYAWPALNRWSQAVLFGKFKTIIDPASGRGIGGDKRVLYCQQRDSHVAKNMFGMPAELYMTDNPAENWSVISKEIY